MYALLYLLMWGGGRKESIEQGSLSQQFIKVGGFKTLTRVTSLFHEYNFK